jgi:hypothetical protein
MMSEKSLTSKVVTIPPAINMTTRLRRPRNDEPSLTNNHYFCRHKFQQWKKAILLTRYGSFAEAGMAAPAVNILPVPSSTRWPGPMAAMAAAAGILF